ncbi:MAG TPA: response regulator [Opitutales bacterium]|nr:response regulator [Opitutales bacterium]
MNTTATELEQMAQANPARWRRMVFHAFLTTGLAKWGQVPQFGWVMAEDFPTKVLIIDDEPHIRAYLRLIVGDAGAKEIKEAGDGPNALLMYQHFEPDLVMLDFNLPGEDGLAILERILAHDPAACVVMMTAVASREMVEKCAAAGALNYIRKDTPRDQILSTLRSSWNDANTE